MEGCVYRLEAIPDMPNTMKEYSQRINAASKPPVKVTITTDPRGASLYVGSGLTDSNYNHAIHQ